MRGQGRQLLLLEHQRFEVLQQRRRLRPLHVFRRLHFPQVRREVKPSPLRVNVNNLRDL